MVTGGNSTNLVERSRNLGVGMGAKEPVSTSVFTEDNDDNLGVRMGAEEPVPTGVFTKDSDEDELIIRFKRAVKTTR